MTIQFGTLEELERQLDRDPEDRRESRRQQPYFDILVQIVKRRKEMGLTQRELAKRVGTHQSQISRIENAEHDIQLSTLVKIAEALDTVVKIQLVEVGEPQWEPMITIGYEAEYRTTEYAETPAKAVQVELNY